jgi:hypothetical protein
MILNDFPPPPLYDFPYDGPGVVVMLPVARADTICRALGVKTKTGERVYGCSLWTAGGCLIVLPSVDEQISRSDQDMVRRVESANCNGWPRGNRE